MVEIAPEFLPIRPLEDNDSIEDFSCGVEQLDGWLSKYAKQAM